jgi:hypothetical protein
VGARVWATGQGCRSNGEGPGAGLRGQTKGHAPGWDGVLKEGRGGPNQFISLCSLFLSSPPPCSQTWPDRQMYRVSEQPTLVMAQARGASRPVFFQPLLTTKLFYISILSCSSTLRATQQGGQPLPPCTSLLPVRTPCWRQASSIN